jgi:hypothetical protein
MYKCFVRLKQPDGSFLVTDHGEVDVRCALNNANCKLPCAHSRSTEGSIVY